jgi:uncharacterized membrane protein YfcA
MNPISLLFIALGALTVLFVGYWVRAIIRSKTDVRFPTPLELGVGFVVNFFDTLGIGMYAPTTSIFKLKRMVDDRLIPGTLNVGSSLTGVLQTFIIVALIAVDARTLLLMIAAATIGAWLGAGVVANLPKRKVQIGMGFALIVSATLMLLSVLKLLPAGGDAIGVTGVALAFAVLVNFILGALMTLGIGMYAPSMIMVSLLGMSPKAAFPIMMGSCAFLVPVASIRFIRERSYSLRPALGLTLGGMPAILIAAFLVSGLPLLYVRWIVIVVVLYAAISMLRSAFAVREIPAEAQIARSS